MSEHKKNREDIVKFAMDELKKTIDALKQGKNPMVSPEFKKMIQTLNEGFNKMNEEKISEKEMDNIVDDVAKKAK